MTPFFIAFTFINAWAVTFFIGMAAMRGRGVWRVLVFNTVMAGLITLGIDLLLKSGWIPLRHVY